MSQAFSMATSAAQTPKQMVLPTLPDEMWLEIIWYSAFDDVWTLKSSLNVEHVRWHPVDENGNIQLNGDPWFFIDPEDVFRDIFKREPAS